MQSPFDIDENDPIALAILRRKLEADIPVVFYRRGREAGVVKEIRKAASGFSGTPNRFPVHDWYTLCHHRGDETLSRGEAQRLLRFSKHDYLAGHLKLELLPC